MSPQDSAADGKTHLTLSALEQILVAAEQASAEYWHCDPTEQQHGQVIEGKGQGEKHHVDEHVNQQEGHTEGTHSGEVLFSVSFSIEGCIGNVNRLIK